MELDIFKKLNTLIKKVEQIEDRIQELTNSVNDNFEVTRNHLVRIKNQQDISDSSILLGSPYNDLSPQQAFDIYKNHNIDFFLLDVSVSDCFYRIKGAKNIPYAELEDRFTELPTGTFPILVISEDGINSIKACEFLVKKGYFNTSNISGGHKCWPGFKEDKYELPPKLKAVS